MCTMCVYMLGKFSNSAALEQQSHKQTAVFSRESAISLCRTASVLQQAINTESITAPRGATGRGGTGKASSERSVPGDKTGGAGYDGGSRMEEGRTGRRVCAASDQMECKAGAICHPQAIHWGRLQYFPLDRSVRQQQGV